MKTLFTSIAILLGIWFISALSGYGDIGAIIVLAGAIIYLIWFLKKKWKGLPPVGWHSDDGGRTWHP